MSQRRTTSGPLLGLRERAEAVLDPEDEVVRDLSPQKVRELVHELQTHQIELEMQNEDLRRAQEELIEARDQYSDFYDFAPVGYVSINEQGLILQANLALAEMLGVARAGLIKRRFSVFVVDDDQNIYYQHHRQLVETKEQQTCELRIRRNGGPPFWVGIVSRTTTAPDTTDDVLIRMVVTDITERKRAEEERQRLERQVRHKQKLESLGVLAGGIAHDFNNILMIILGNADLALRDLSPLAPACGNIKEVLQATHRAADLTRQMLAYSGKGRFVIEPIQLNDMVKEMSHLLEASISKKALLKHSFGRDIPVFDGDATQIRQIVMNLITNASEAIGDKSGVITISTGAMDCHRDYLDDVKGLLRTSLDESLPEGRYVYLEVVDTGCGMDAETQEKLFDPFFTTKFSGRGLGMAAVSGIVRGHKGTIKIDSRPDKGATFRVLFPASESHAALAKGQELGGAGAQEWRGQGTVLVVDDEEPVRFLAERMVERIGFSVLTACDGHEALEVFREHADEIVCVLLDLTMPRLDGEQTFDELRRIRPEVKVILCSGYNEQETTQRFVGKGLAGFVQKPYTLATLVAKLKEISPARHPAHELA